MPESLDLLYLCLDISLQNALYRYTADPTGSMAKSGANGSSIYFLDRFYDNVFVRRKGVTSLSWPKPKLKFELLKNVRHLVHGVRVATPLRDKLYIG